MSTRSIISSLVGGFLTVVLTMYVTRRVGTGGRPGELRFGGFMWVLGVACIVFALLPLVMTGKDDAGESAAKVALIAMFGLGAAYCFAEAAFVRGRFDADRIEFQTPWTGTKRESWRDLRSIEIAAWCGWYTLTFASGAKIRLSIYLTGHQSALEAAEAALAGAARDDA
jgi:hypothetical protein